MLVAAGCTATTAGTDDVKIGLLTSLSGTYQAAGEDLRDGFQLYLDTHDGKLGDRTVSLVVADEGDGPATALPAATRMVKQERVVALTGIVASGTFQAVSAMTSENRIPLIGANGRPRQVPDPSYLWQTSFTADQAGAAVAQHIKDTINGPVWVIGPDYVGGHEQITGFTDAFTAAGGQLANPGGKPTWTPFPTTTNFLPYLAQIRSSGAKAIYTFYAGRSAIDLVRQYSQSDVKNIPLYGAFLTEGAVLQAQGAASEGVWNISNYSPQLDNPANRTFVEQWAQRFPRTPTPQAMAAYDAAAVLDKAIAAAGNKVTADTINKAIAGLGDIDSPRGTWRFSPSSHVPIQRWYLSVARRDGERMSNQLVQELATVGS
ncbi:ABC transporter substrate-binding protein [Micromonospora sediminicola]|uniref:ABC transporter substrate-binding protein n=1 Tax=Micromonospora sediminicola TaxID=946078 RepID=UPI0033FE510D